MTFVRYFFHGDGASKRLFLAGALAAGLMIGSGARGGDFVNGDFETGTAGFAPPSPWIVNTFINSTGLIVVPPSTPSDLQLSPGGTAKTVILSSPNGPLSRSDPDVPALHWPMFGNQCTIINQKVTPSNVNRLSQTAVLSSSSLDPSDGKYHVRFVFAPVLQNGAHSSNQQPYCFIVVSNVTRGRTLASYFLSPVTTDNQGPTWQTIGPAGAGQIYYTDWQLIDVTGDSSILAAGDTVNLAVFASDCQPGSHFSQIYIDQVGLTIPGVFVTGTAIRFPDSDGTHTDITYALTYRNGGTSAQTGVQFNFSTPPNTTFLSANAPGVSLVTPAVGASGTLTGTVGSFAAGASGSATVTVRIVSGATGPFVAYNYSILSTQSFEPLIGPSITPLPLAPLAISEVRFASGSFTLSFSNTHGLSFSVLRTPDLMLPLSNWVTIGHPTEISPGNFEFTDTTVTNAQKDFYRVSWP